MSSTRIPNNNGSQNALLNSVKSDALKTNVSCLSTKEKALAESIINNVFSSYLTRDKFENNITSVSTDAILGRIASLLDEVKADFTSSELEHVKQTIIQEIQNILIDPKLNANDKIDIQQLLIGIVNQFQDIQNNLLITIKKQIQTFISNNNINLQQNTDDVIKNINIIQNQNAENIENSIEQINDNSSNNLEANVKNEKNDDVEFITTELLKLNVFIGNTFQNINVNLLNILDKVDKVTSKIDNVIQNIAILLPTSKSKKEKKKLNDQQNKIEKIIIKISEQVDMIYNFATNFTNTVISNLQSILDKSFSAIVKFWLKLVATTIVPTLILVGTVLHLLIKPLMTALQPLLNTIQDIFGKILDFLAPIRDFVIKVLKSIFDIIEPALVAFFKGLAAVAEPIAKGLCLFVRAVLKVLSLLMKGIAAGAFALGKALITLAKYVINILVLFMKGIKPFARAIGIGLGLFVRVVLDILCFVMKGIKHSAKAIGIAVGKVVLALVEVLELFIMFLENCVGILVAIVGSIRDFFEGLRTRARACGEMLGTIIYNFFKGFDKRAKEIGQAVAQLCLVTTKLVTKILKFFLNFKRMFELHVEAPFNAFKRKLNAMKVAAAETSFKYPVDWTWDWGMDGWKPWVSVSLVYNTWKPFAWLTGGMSSKDIAQAKEDKDKSVYQMRAEEIAKYKKKYEEEDRAAELDKLRAKLNEDKMKKMVENINIVDELFQLSKSLHSFIKGEDNTKAILAAVKTKVEDLNEVEQIKLNDQQVKTDLQNQLQESKQEGIEQLKDKTKTEADFLKDLINYLTQNFNAIFNKVKQPNYNVIPLNTDSNTNISNMEDM